MHLLLFHEVAQTDSISISGSTTHHSNTHGTHTHEQGPHVGPDGDTIVARANTPMAVTVLASPAQGRGPPDVGRPASCIGDEENDRERQDGSQTVGVTGSRPCSATSQADRGGGGGSASGYGASGGIHSAASTTGKNGRFSTAGRVREFRTVLRGAAAHASKMKVRKQHRCSSRASQRV